jgi:multisubunit Na+/H+ antiporter MnhC subunit
MVEVSYGRVASRGSERGFGLVVGGVLLLLGARGLIEGTIAGRALGGLGVTLIVLGFVAPRRLRSANELWHRLGLLLGRVVSPVVMLLVFTAVVIPTSAVMRLTGKDPLRRRDRRAESFWVVRTGPTSFRDQF